MGSLVSPGFQPTSGHIGELVCVHSNAEIRTNAMHAEQGFSKIKTKNWKSWTSQRLLGWATSMKSMSAIITIYRCIPELRKVCQIKRLAVSIFQLEIKRDETSVEKQQLTCACDQSSEPFQSRRWLLLHPGYWRRVKSSIRDHNCHIIDSCWELLENQSDSDKLCQDPQSSTEMRQVVNIQELLQMSLRWNRESLA